MSRPAFCKLKLFFSIRLYNMAFPLFVGCLFRPNASSLFISLESLRCPTAVSKVFSITFRGTQIRDPCLVSWKIYWPKIANMASRVVVVVHSTYYWMEKKNLSVYNHQYDDILISPYFMCSVHIGALLSPVFGDYSYDLRISAVAFN